MNTDFCDTVRMTQEQLEESDLGTNFAYKLENLGTQYKKIIRFEKE